MPSYRVVYGQAKSRNPYHGWQPLLFSEPEMQRLVCQQKVTSSVRELEHLVSGKGDITIPLAGHQVEIICQMADSPILPISIFLSKNSAIQILEAVRNKLLEWVLAINKAGIRGEGLSFSPKEKAVAHNPHITYHIGQIGSFAGNLGGHVGRDVVASLHNDGVNVLAITNLVRQIRALEDQMGLSSLQKADMRQHVDALDAEIQKPAPERGKLADLLTSVKATAEGAAGNLVASGVVALVAKILGG